jgi:hypothetical protein
MTFDYVSFVVTIFDYVYFVVALLSGGNLAERNRWG